MPELEASLAKDSSTANEGLKQLLPAASWLLLAVLQNVARLFWSRDFYIFFFLSTLECKGQINWHRTCETTNTKMS